MPTNKVLITGATGYVGQKLLARFQAKELPIRCLARSPEKLAALITPGQAEVVQGDVLKPDSLPPAFIDVKTAYYLIHSMSGAKDFESKDRQAAENFLRAAESAGVERIIYLGGLGDEGESLSPHLRSRQEVGKILRGGSVKCIELQASVIIGAGSLSFDLIRKLTHRLPVMLCPRWLRTDTQPIAIADVLSYLEEAKDVAIESSRIFQIGGTDVVGYGDLIKAYAKVCGLRRWLISVPVLTPKLSSLWLALVTPTKAEVGRHLIEGLKNPTVVRDDSALQAFSVRPRGIEQAIREAIAEEQEEVKTTSEVSASVE